MKKLLNIIKKCIKSEAFQKGKKIRMVCEVSIPSETIIIIAVLYFLLHN